MSIDGYVACICEGAAEKVIIDLLLDNDKLIFNRKQMIDRQVIPCRDGKSFEVRYLRKGFDQKITVYRILDSRREKFKMSKAYAEKIEIVNVITAPEIEMLVIFNEDKYKDYKKSGLKPNEYCKSHLRYKDIKSYLFIKEYFKDISKLVLCIKQYKSKSAVRNGEFSLHDLLKPEFQ